MHKLSYGLAIILVAGLSQSATAAVYDHQATHHARHCGCTIRHAHHRFARHRHEAYRADRQEMYAQSWDEPSPAPAYAPPPPPPPPPAPDYGPQPPTGDAIYNFYGPTTNYFAVPSFPPPMPDPGGYWGGPTDDGCRMDPWCHYDPHRGLENGY